MDKNMSEPTQTNRKKSRRPDSEPDPKKYYMGGCTSEGEWHKYKCIKCGWEGS